MSNKIPLDGLFVRLNPGEPKTIRSLQANRDFHFAADGTVGADIYQSLSTDALASLSEPRVEDFYQAFRQVAPKCHSQVNVCSSDEDERFWGKKFELDSLAESILGPGWGNAHYGVGVHGADWLTVSRPDQLGGFQSLKINIPYDGSPGEGGKKLQLTSQAEIEGVKMEHTVSKEVDYSSGVNVEGREYIQFYPVDWQKPKFQEI